MLTYITIRYRAVTVLRGYENAWQRPSRVRRLGDGTTRQFGPHTQSMYQIALPPALLASFLPWLMLNRDGLSILLHPGTGDAYADHIEHAVWLGSALPLRMNVLRRRGGRRHIPERLRCPPE
jgi:aromatic ring-cleaving dioxygenase